jgi:hypothetical protein
MSKILRYVDFVNESLVLSNYDEYAKIVSDAYDAAPEFDESMLPSYNALIDHAENVLYPQILGKGIDVQFVDYDPYETRDEMASDVQDNKVLKISSLFNEHPVLTEEQNLIFRAVHDYYTHIVCNQNFGLRGELKAYNTHARLAPVAALPALFTEVVGQVCYAIVHGTIDEDGNFMAAFGNQKVCRLDGFDYKKVGVVSGYNISGKKLFKK